LVFLCPKERKRERKREREREKKKRERQREKKCGQFYFLTAQAKIKTNQQDIEKSGIIYN
jgi:hypothetical protein